MDKIELPNCLIPKYKAKLIRFGSEYDGGYLINENDIKDSDTLISLGIHDDWEFENEIYKNSKIKNIILFDPETSYLLIFKYLLISIVKFNFKKLKSNFLKFKKLDNLKSYSTFFNQKFDKNLVLKYMNSKNIIFKIDIEGDEYKDLKFILDHQEKINSLIIEFHDVGKNYDIIYKFIMNFKLNLIHTHINTFSQKNNIAIELSFSRHAPLSNEKWCQSDLDHIDFPNHPKHRNVEIISSAKNKESNE
jgi:hypothetical protein